MSKVQTVAKEAAQSLLDRLGFEIRRRPVGHQRNWADPASAQSVPDKALSTRDKFREIVSDPLNLLIERDAMAGVVYGNLVRLHTGLARIMHQTHAQAA